MRGFLLYLLSLSPVVLPLPAHAQRSEVSGPWHVINARISGDREMLASDQLMRAEAAFEVGYFPLADSLWNEIDSAGVDRWPYLELGAAIQLSLGQLLPAAHLFEHAAASADGELRGALLARAADVLEHAGDELQALQLYQSASQYTPRLRPWLALRVARLSCDTNRIFVLLAEAPRPARERAAIMRAGLRVASGDRWVADSIYASLGRYIDAARLSLLVGDSARARGFIMAGLESLDDSVRVSAVMLAREVFREPTAPEYSALGRALLRSGDLEAAVYNLERAVQVGDSSPSTYRMLGLALRNSGRNEDALAAYEAAFKSGTDEALRAHFDRGVLLLRLRRYGRATAVLSQLAREFPEHPLAARAQFLVADILADADHLGRADSVFRMLVSTWPRSERAGEARSRLAALALERNDRSGALRWYGDQLDAHPRDARTRFKLARLLSSNGDTASSRTAMTQLADIDTLGYYGMLARVALSRETSFDTVPSVPPASGRVLQMLEQYDLLNRAGMARELDEMLAYMTERVDLDPAESLSLAEGLIERVRTKEAVSIGWRVAGRSSLNDPRVLRIIFPWPFRELIEKEAAETDLDPHLVAAIIRQESLFVPSATSRAGARGMMQLMPSTAREIAARLNVQWADNLLGVADANIHLATVHLSGLLRRYRGDEVLALAAYNAGSGNLARWLRRFGRINDPVLFIERIPFAETRGYIRTVLRNRDLYRALYPLELEGTVQ